MTHLMKEVVEFGTGRRAKVLGRPVAGKTGTSNDNRDAWFVGFTPQVSTIVWVGFDSQVSLGSAETGANAALPIWIDYMGRVLSRLPVEDFRVPEGIVFVPIDPESGKIVSARNPKAYSEAFIAGTEPGTAGGKRAEYLGGDFKGVAPIANGQTNSSGAGGMTPPPIPVPKEDPSDAPSIGADEEYLKE
jgi:penicillin-binding protein 1A